MATKVIVRWHPSSPVYGQREFSVKDFEALGIFTQRTPLVFEAQKGNWLAADDAEISKEAQDWLVNNPDNFGSFTVEDQEVPDELVQPQETTPQEGAPVEGESPTTSSSTKTRTSSASVPTQTPRT